MADFYGAGYQLRDILHLAAQTGDTATKVLNMRNIVNALGASKRIGMGEDERILRDLYEAKTDKNRRLIAHNYLNNPKPYSACYPFMRSYSIVVGNYDVFRKEATEIYHSSKNCTLRRVIINGLITLNEDAYYVPLDPGPPATGFVNEYSLLIAVIHVTHAENPDDIELDCETGHAPFKPEIRCLYSTRCLLKQNEQVFPLNVDIQARRRLIRDDHIYVYFQTLNADDVPTLSIPHIYNVDFSSKVFGRDR